MDTGDWAGEYADTELVRLAGRAIFVLHDLKTLQIDPVALGIDVVVSGHSHVPKIDTVGGVLYLNPGSAGRRRFKLPITLATLEITPDCLRPVIHDLERDWIPPEVLEGPLQRGRLEKDERGSERETDTNAHRAGRPSR